MTTKTTDEPDFGTAVDTDELGFDIEGASFIGIDQFDGCLVLIDVLSEGTGKSKTPGQDDYTYYTCNVTYLGIGEPGPDAMNDGAKVGEFHYIEEMRISNAGMIGRLRLQMKKGRPFVQRVNSQASKFNKNNKAYGMEDVPALADRSSNEFKAASGGSKFYKANQSTPFD